MGKSRGFEISEETQSALDMAESTVAKNLGRYSQSQLRRMQKSLRNEIMYRALSTLNRKYMQESRSQLDNK